MHTLNLGSLSMEFSNLDIFIIITGVIVLLLTFVIHRVRKNIEKFERLRDEQRNVGDKSKYGSSKLSKTKCDDDDDDDIDLLDDIVSDIVSEGIGGMVDDMVETLVVPPDPIIEEVEEPRIVDETEMITIDDTEEDIPELVIPPIIHEPIEPIYTHDEPETPSYDSGSSSSSYGGSSSYDSGSYDCGSSDCGGSSD